MSPYHIEGPAQICFSGGRTSAYMLHSILDANDGLPNDVHVTFQNTGKEREETLAFAAECSYRWGIQIHWLEWLDVNRETGKFRMPEIQEVSFATAARNGEPFERLIRAKRHLPNVRHRICTANLKIRVGERFMRDRGYDSWSAAIGIRADEPRRVSRMRTPGRDNSAGDPLLPLARANIRKADVLAFWKRMPFDLQLDPAGDLGNCDLCFLKARHKLVKAIQAEPQRPVWWIKQQETVGSLFLKNYVGYEDLAKEAAWRNTQIELLDDEELGEDLRLADCMCGD